jgi:hypothetical protein
MPLTRLEKMANEKYQNIKANYAAEVISLRHEGCSEVPHIDAANGQFSESMDQNRWTEILSTVHASRDVPKISVSRLIIERD